MIVDAQGVKFDEADYEDICAAMEFAFEEVFSNEDAYVTRLENVGKKRYLCF